MTRGRNLIHPAILLALALVAGCATADGNGGGGDVDASSRFADARPALPDAEPVNTCPTQPCDLHEQCGCPSGEACDLEFLNFDENEFSDQLACRAVLTPGNLLSTCSSHTRCAAGFQCIGGQCRRYCQTNDDCEGECTLVRSGSQRDDDRLCTKRCQPDYEADHGQFCPKDFACYTRFFGSDDNRRVVTDCLTAGSGGVGASCELINNCGEGLHCINFTVDGQTEGRCQLRCRVADQTCPGGAACEGFSNPTIADGVEYGFCRS
jgi:hypothetical protein